MKIWYFQEFCVSCKVGQGLVEIIKTVGVDNSYTSLDSQVHSLGLDRIDSFRGWQTVQCTRLGYGKKR